MEIMDALKRTEHLVTDPTVKAISLVNERAFTRRREGGMDFSDALRFMLDMNKTALQARLNKFYGQAKGGKAISQPAFTKLRANCSELLCELTFTLIHTSALRTLTRHSKSFFATWLKRSIPGSTICRRGAGITFSPWMVRIFSCRRSPL